MKKFAKRIKELAAKLGLTQALESKSITKEQQQQIVEAYNAEYGDGAFEEDSAEVKKEQEEARHAAEVGATFNAIAEALGADGKDVSAVLEQVRDLLKENKDLAGASAGDTPQTVETVTLKPHGVHTKEYAFGIPHEIFAAGRRYNRIAITGKVEGKATEKDMQDLFAAAAVYNGLLSDRIQALHLSGELKGLNLAALDLSAASNDPEIGTRHFTVRQDALIAYLATLPSLEGIFPKLSNIQSGTLITNVLVGETSQAYQSGRVTKGDIKVLPEKGYVHKCMSKLEFEDMSALETSYLNYLNKEGSSPVKWTMIEWIIVLLAKQITNERNRRAILGHRVEPVKGKAGLTMTAAFGVVQRLFGYVDEFKLLPFMDDSVAMYTKDNIGEVLDVFVELLKENTDFAEDMIIYMNKNHHAWYKAWYEERYGVNNDYTGVNSSKVHNHDLSIKWVPNMGQTCLIFATLEGNIQLLENVPGEEHNVYFQRDMETVITAAYWMEGAGASFVGPKYASQALLAAADYADQVIFMNWPAVPVDADATVIPTKVGLIVRAGKKNKATALTDITGVKEGIVIRVEIGDATYPTSIAKSGKFADISKAWTPTKVGEYIKLYYDKAEGKFFEVARG